MKEKSSITKQSRLMGINTKKIHGIGWKMEKLRKRRNEHEIQKETRGN